MRRSMFLLSGAIIFVTCGPPYAYVPDLPNPGRATFRYVMSVGYILFKAGLVVIDRKRAL